MSRPTSESSEAESPKGNSLRPMIKGLLMIASLAAIGYVVSTSGIKQALDTAWIDSEIAGRGFIGLGFFLLAGGLATSVGIPRQIVAFLGGYAFGVVMGTLWAVLAAAIGCCLAFYFARLLGRDMVKSRFARRIARVDSLLARHTFSMTLLIRFLPVGSNVLTNLAAGVSSVQALPFIGGSTLGYIPQTLVFALAGKAMKLDPNFELDPVVSLLLAGALFIMSGLIGVWLFRRVRQERLQEAANKADFSNNSPKKEPSSQSLTQIDDPLG